MTVPKPERLRVDNLPTVFPNAAGLDIGSAEIGVALPPDRDVTVVRTFTTFTGDLKQWVTWLLDHHIETVAMESTGVYWIPIYEMLETAAIRVSLWSMRATAQSCRVGSRTTTTPSGCRSFTPSAC